MQTYQFSKPMTLKYDVTDGASLLIPAGTPNVEIAFGQSSKTYVINKKTNKIRYQNVYRWNGVIYNA